MARTSKTATSTATTQTNTDARIGAAEGSVVVTEGGSIVTNQIDSETAAVALETVENVAGGAFDLGETSLEAAFAFGDRSLDVVQNVTGRALEEAFAFGESALNELQEGSQTAIDRVAGAASEAFALSRSEQNQALETVARAVMVIGGLFAVAWIFRSAK